MTTPLEKAAGSICEASECERDTTCEYCKEVARSVVTAYLRALHEQGASEGVREAVNCPSYCWNVWKYLLSAHIADLEDGK